MTDYQNGYTPASPDSPEPPYRGFAPQAQQPALPDDYAASTAPSPGSQELPASALDAVSPDAGVAAWQPAVQEAQAQPLPDTSGIDMPGELASTSAYSPLPSSDKTENFTFARMGDTGAMPAVSAAADPVPAPAPQEAAGLPSSAPATSYAAAQASQAPYVPGPAQAGSSQASQYGSSAAAAPMFESGYASDRSPDAAAPASAYAGKPYASSVAAGTAAQAPTATAAGVAAAGSKGASKAKSGAGAGKTFLFGFLGAALACGLAFGANAALGASNASVPVIAGSTAVIGTTDQSIINATEEGMTLAEAVAEKALPSVVAIYNYQNQSSGYGYGFGYGYGAGGQADDSLVATGMGSGVVISDEGYIITNYHVVEDAAKLTVSVNGTERDATYVGGDSSSDIAVIKVEDNEGLVTADIGDSDSLRIGEWVMTVGAPLGLESSVATGVVSATNRSTIMDSASSSGDLYSYFYGSQTPEYTYYPNMIQTDAVINPGNSGGALVDADGKLIGINAMISSYSGDYAGVGFAIPINYAIQIAQSVIEGKEVTHAMVGVSLSQVNSQIASQYNLSAESGAYISAITPDSGAANSDLQVGDIITKVDGKAVTSPTDVTLEVRAHKVGDTIPITVNRDGETLDIDVTLTSDESIAQSSEEEKQSQGPSRDKDQGEDRDDDWGNGRGNGGGYSIEDIERLFDMLGM